MLVELSMKILVHCSDIGTQTGHYFYSVNQPVPPYSFKTTGWCRGRVASNRYWCYENPDWKLSRSLKCTRDKDVSTRSSKRLNSQEKVVRRPVTIQHSSKLGMTLLTVDRRCILSFVNRLLRMSSNVKRFLSSISFRRKKVQAF